MELSELDKHAQSKIEASVVLHSLSKVCSELVINSLNSAADYIEVIVKNKLVEVRDNGKGMNLEDLLHSLKSHCTLQRLFALGKVQVVSRHKGSSWKYDGEVKSSTCLSKPGCIVRATELFKDFPARITEFYEEEAAEVTCAIEKYLMVRPQTTLKLLYAKRVIEYQKKKSLRERIFQIVGKVKMKHVKYVGHCLELEGYTSKLQEGLHFKGHQYLYYDFLPFENEDIQSRLNSLYRKAYKLLFQSTEKHSLFPCYVLLVKMREVNFSLKNQPHREIIFAETLEVLKEVTVMIKEQVFTDQVCKEICDKYISLTAKKRNRAEIVQPETYSFIPELDDKSLAEYLETYSPTTSKPIKTKNFKPETLIKQPKFTNPSTHSVELTPILPENLKNFQVPSPKQNLTAKPIFTQVSFKLENPQILKVLGQVEFKFIALVIKSQDKHLLTALDQHAAHERIRLEQLQSSLHKDLEPHSVSVPLNISNFEKQLVFKQKKKLQNWKFEVKAEENQLVLVQVPKLYGKIMGKEELLRIVHNNSIIPEPILETIKSKACRSAVKFGDELSFERCTQLCYQLQDCALKTQCAHGRPTFYPLIELPQTPKPSQILVNIKF